MLLANPGCHPATRMFCGTSFFLVVCEWASCVCVCVHLKGCCIEVRLPPPTRLWLSQLFFFFYYFLIAKECRFCACKTKLSFRAKKRCRRIPFCLQQYFQSCIYDCTICLSVLISRLNKTRVIYHLVLHHSLSTESSPQYRLLVSAEMLKRSYFGWFACCADFWRHS